MAPTAVVAIHEKPRVCIISVAFGGAYPKGQRRLVNSLAEVGFTGKVISWTDEWPPGSPTHKACPYAFKLHAIHLAARQGFDIVLWMDSSVWFTKNPEPLVEHVRWQGYWFMTHGWNVGQWCVDAALPKLGVTREETFTIPMLAATFFGLDFRQPLAWEILRWMLARSLDGSFVGPWKINDGRPASDARKVLGHRHDQTALSVIRHKMDLNFDWPPSYFAYHLPGKLHPPVVLGVAQGL